MLNQTAPWNGCYVSLDQEMLALASEAGLSSRALQVYVWLRRYRNRRTDLCCPRQETLAEGIGVSVRTVRNAVAELARAGFVRIVRHRSEKTGNLGVNRYSFPPAEIIQAALRRAAGMVREAAEAVETAAAHAVEAVKESVATLSRALDLRRIAAEARNKHAGAAEKRDERRAAPPPGKREGDKVNSSDVRAYFEEAAAEHWPDLGRLPVWTGREQAQAKLLLEHHGAERTKEMVFHLWRNRLHYNLTGIPTPGLLWAMQSRIVGEIVQGITDLSEHKRLAYKSASCNTPDRSNRINQSEWTRDEAARGILTPEDILSEYGK